MKMIWKTKNKHKKWIKLVKKNYWQGDKIEISEHKTSRKSMRFKQNK